MTVHDDVIAVSQDHPMPTSASSSFAWGRTMATVLIGVILGSTYSVVNRPVTAASVPTELAAITHQDRSLQLADAGSLMMPFPAATSARGVEIEPAQTQTAEVPPAMSFRSITTLSATPSKTEADVLKSEAPIVVSDADDDSARPAAKPDAVAAVWGFLAVGLGGSTATAATIRRNVMPPR